MSSLVKIYFNDTIIGTTANQITFQRESDVQKEFHITDKRTELNGVFFCENVELMQNEHIIVEVIQ